VDDLRPICADHQATGKTWGDEDDLVVACFIGRLGQNDLTVDLIHAEDDQAGETRRRYSLPNLGEGSKSLSVEDRLVQRLPG
jgi:hypothetical protein